MNILTPKMKDKIKFKSQHNLNFEIAVWEFNELFDSDNAWVRFRIGTCHGLFCSTDESYIILAIDNNDKGNGHLNDVFEWFENSCKRDDKALEIVELWNKKFKKHLISKRDFIINGKDKVIKKFNS